MAPRGSEIHFKICSIMFTWHIDAEQPQQPRLMELSLVLQLFDQRAKQRTNIILCECVSMVEKGLYERGNELNECDFDCGSSCRVL